jgi:hypothetical protein
MIGAGEWGGRLKSASPTGQCANRDRGATTGQQQVRASGDTSKHVLPPLARVACARRTARSRPILTAAHTKGLQVPPGAAADILHAPWVFFIFINFHPLEHSYRPTATTCTVPPPTDPLLTVDCKLSSTSSLVPLQLNQGLKQRRLFLIPIVSLRACACAHRGTRTRTCFFPSPKYALVKIFSCISVYIRV